MESKLCMKRISAWVLVFCLMAAVIVYSGPTSAKASGAEGMVEYYSMNAGGERTALWLTQLVSDFEEETGIKVNLRFAGRDILTKIRSRLVMGDPPDIIEQDLSELSAALLGDEILATSLDDFFYNQQGPEGQDKFMDIFNENLIRAYAKDETLYFLPYGLFTSGFHYDVNLFEQFSLTPPKTMEEFYQVCDVLKENNIAPLAADGSINYYNAYYYYWACARILGSGAFNNAAGDKTAAAWDDPGFLQAAQLVYDLGEGGKDYFQKGYSGSVYPAAQGDWVQGMAGSILCGSWIPLETSNQAKEGFQYGFYPFPTVEGGKGSETDCEIQLLGCAIPKNAKNIDNAKLFLNFMFRKDNVEKYAVNLMPIRKDVDSVLLHDIKEYINTSETFHISYDGVMGEYPEWFANVFYSLDNELFFGSITPEEFIKEIKEKSLEFWMNK